MKRLGTSLRNRSQISRSRRRRIFMKNNKLRLQARREVFFVQQNA